MSAIEDYALIGDTHSAALVGRDGSIDWLCLPRFDSEACFAALLDEERGGRWRIAPADEVTSVERAYRRDSMVLETTFHTTTGTVVLIDCLPLEQASAPDDPRAIEPEDVIARIVRGSSGTVRMSLEYSPRFDYGEIVPWFREHDGVIEAVGGPHALDLIADVPLRLEENVVLCDFEVTEGETMSFIARHHESHLTPRVDRRAGDCTELIEKTDRFWRDWVSTCGYDGPWRDAVFRSLLTLKALTYSPTGGIVAAPTTSLPEAIGGVRNWDYRYCWLRDSTFMLSTFLDHGFESEAREWRDWLLRAVAGDPEDLQIMYGVKGERRLIEWEPQWLRGYENSRPVRIGNAAAEQFQLDVYGEVMDTLHAARMSGIPIDPSAWELQRVIVDHVCAHWQEPDEGIWEVRSDRRHFVHSKVMAWVAVDRGLQAIERFQVNGDAETWARVRDEIQDEVMTKGISRPRGCFKRAYDEDELDAALLILPIVGFVDANEEPMRATIEAIENELMVDGFVMRYRSDVADDGLPPGEGAFLMCTFWLVNCLVLLDRRPAADELFERLLTVGNDVGLLSEQYDTQRGRLVGNFPQAFSHTALLASVAALTQGAEARPIARRGR